MCSLIVYLQYSCEAYAYAVKHIYTRALCQLHNIACNQVECSGGLTSLGTVFVLLLFSDSTVLLLQH